MIKRMYLIVRADKSARLVTRLKYDLRDDEVAFTLQLKFPDSWGKYQTGVLEIEVPDVPRLTS